MGFEVIVAEHAGFCFGVRRAIRMAEQALAERGALYCIGPLIHNRQAVDKLAAMGMRTVESPAEAGRDAPVMIRTHGASPELYEELRKRGFEILDATCPFVQRAHRRARELAEAGYQVVVLGDRQHPETRGISASAGGAIVVERAEEIDGVQLGRKVGIVSQTTQRMSELEELVRRVVRRVQEVAVANTICDATAQRQAASERLARQVDVMVVVGGYHSANTRRLAEICASTGTPTHHIEVAEELRPKWFEGARRVGVTAGASTPDEMIRAVVERLVEIGGEGSRAIWPNQRE